MSVSPAVQVSRNDILVQFLENVKTVLPVKNNTYIPDEEYTGNIYSCHIWLAAKKLCECDHINKELVNEILTLRDGADFYQEKSPWYLKVVVVTTRSHPTVYKFMLIDAMEEDGAYTLVQIIPKRSLIFPVRTKNARALGIIQTITEQYRLLYPAVVEEAAEKLSGKKRALISDDDIPESVKRRRFEADEAEEETETEGEDEDEEEEEEEFYDDDLQNCNLAWNDYEFMSGVYSCV
jgi:hypothetical protein